MATVVLQYAGQALGTFLGGPVGGILGRAIGGVAGNFIDQALFGPGTRRVEGPRLNDLRIMASSEGTPVPRLWGRMRIAGQVIWATRFEEVTVTHTEKASSKGGGVGGTKVTEYQYFANVALALCEGEVARLGRVWADGKEIDISEFTVRLHTGSETQLPDSLIVAKEGAANAPAYRGTAYVVFERWPVNAYGNRVPQLSFEVFRNAGGIEAGVKAVNIIPGSTEFGYDTQVVTRDVGQGVTESENAHASAIRSNWTVSLDGLGAACGNLEAVSLVTAWFGTDVRCGSALLKPGVEAAVKATEPETWSVGGVSRSAAHVVSSSGGGPAFGGTPSDASVIRAIQDLRARGLAVVFYPFILMDVAAGNGLPDPYGGGEQGAYPWRGRITCHPAPGQPGSPDGTAACATQVQAIVGTAQASHFTASSNTISYSGPNEWSLRRMVLHYAKLCALAGGVDAFLISSELRGLTTLRGAANSFPFVAALVSLAADVKAILPAARISYAADWSEYFGNHPAGGQVFFHLDPLWASANVGFVGIDNYMPLSDWRDGHQHTDYLAGTRSLYDVDYLKAGIAGGEGFDWYYASDVDRLAQVRSPISDGAYGKPWVFRYKDLKSWWSNAHYNRPGGVQSATPTAWVPQSKPIWFTEAGCAAIDKGTNQPNAFVDAKSSENLLPHFSSGQRDDYLQNRAIAALTEYWTAAGAHNPVSSSYGGPMVDPSRLFLWAWDARPYPFFPARADIWADSVNYPRGHWLNGRIGAVPLANLIAAVCAAYGFADYDVQGVEGLVDGFVIDRAMSARDALEGLLAAFAVDVTESAGLLKFRMRSRAPVIAIGEADLVERDAEAPLLAITRAQETELPASLRLAYVESGLDYRRAAVEAKRQGGGSDRDVFIDLPCAIEQAPAQIRADIGLQESWAAREAVELILGPRHARLEAGDVVSLGLASGTRQFRIEEIADGNDRKLRGRSYLPAVFEAPDAPPRSLTSSAAVIYGRPDAVILDLPVARAGSQPHAPWTAATARPWPGSLAVYRSTGPTTFEFNRSIDARATMGLLLDALPSGPLYRFDRGTALTVKLATGALASVSDAELLRGRNIAAIGTADGWEILQFAEAELVGSQAYRISKLLRGQSGSETEVLALRPAGSRFVLLNGAVVQPALSLSDAALLLTWKIGPAQYDIARNYTTIEHRGRLLGLRPWTPSHPRMAADGGDLVISWLRRTRIDGDSWDLAEVPLGEERESYALDILDGATLKRSTTVSQPLYRYQAADIAADFGGVPATLTLRIAQISAAYGRGANLLRTIHA